MSDFYKEKVKQLIRQEMNDRKYEKELLTLTLKNGKIEIELSAAFLRKIAVK